MLAELTCAIDGLAETDPHALTETELHDTVVQLHRLHSRLAAVALDGPGCKRPGDSDHGRSQPAQGWLASLPS
jgi:hypothetical protein